ncbi:hypothetical protein PsYK624_073470 [Phanerochaete sordida]|uniref:Uncharacterized protein n=1 Tax=Phanerochaete sordida TaxID=48140 RepID=A0A9P3LE73_9APHY|nr:hypothetical protein PsYK624_073470 [Phanerochaete sordida]
MTTHDFHDDLCLARCRVSSSASRYVAGTRGQRYDETTCTTAMPIDARDSAMPDFPSPFSTRRRPKLPRVRTGRHVSTSSSLISTPPLSPTGSASSVSDLEDFEACAPCYLESGDLWPGDYPSSLRSHARDSMENTFTFFRFEDESTDDPTAPIQMTSTTERSERTHRDNVRTHQSRQPPRTPPSENALRTPQSLRAEFFAILASRDERRYIRAQQLGASLFAPSSRGDTRRAQESSAPPNHSGKYSRVDARSPVAASPSCDRSPQEPESGTYDAPTPPPPPRTVSYHVHEHRRGDPHGQLTPGSDCVRHSREPQHATSDDPPPPPPLRAPSSARRPLPPARSDPAPRSDALRPWPSVDAYASGMRRAISASQTRFRPLAEDPAFRLPRHRVPEPVAYEACASGEEACMAGSAKRFGRPRRAGYVGGARRTLGPAWREALGRGVWMAKQWARVARSGRPRLRDVGFG